MRHPLTLLVAACVLVFAAPAQAITTTGDAVALANSALRSPAALLGASWDVSADPAASAVATESLQGFPTDGSDYLVLSSGNAAEAANPDQAAFTSMPNSGGMRGGAIDVLALRVNLEVPTGANCLTFSFRYLSEEWPEFVGGGFNDGFLAELDPSEPWTMTNHEIAAPANFAFMPGGAFVSINAAAMTAEDAAGTVYDGGTELLSAAAAVTTGSHALVLSVWDDGDTGFDSAAFIDDIALFTAPQGGCLPGATPADTTAPDTAVDSGPSGQSSSADASFGFSADEAGATFECKLDDGAWASCNSPQAYGHVGDGPHTFFVRALDELGNVDATPASRSWTVDTTPPAPPEILAGPSGATEDVSAHFALAGEPGATLECRMDGAAWVVCSDSLDLDGLALGQHALQVRQVDAAGNVSAVAERVWTIAAHAVSDEVARAFTGSVGSRVRRGGRRVAVVDGGRVPVGCVLDRGAMRRCTVHAFAAGDLVGRGTARYAPGVHSGRVKVQLSPRMQARLGRTRKMPRTTFVFRADVVGRAKAMTARRTAFLAPRRQWILPSDGLFESGSARLLPQVRAYLRTIAPEIESARAVHCVGHTDSIGTHAANKRLGLRRARAVCTHLRRLGFRGRRMSSSRGETSPRATNRTWAGRWSNRRVELRTLR
jgi:outer membrane protein OmpA-like peptidoglycan-associated protein